MALTEGQVQIRDLVLGPGTPYTLKGFNPFTRNTRADQGGPRAWNHGTWSGVEFLDETAIPIRIFTNGGSRTTSSWLNAHFDLMAAFEPIGDGTEDVELRFMLGGEEYVMFGRPRMVEPDVETIGIGKGLTEAAFVANNPRIYSGEEQMVMTTLPKFVSGAAVPLYTPIYITGVKIGGEFTAENQGRAITPVRLRIDGPAPHPRIIVTDPDGNNRSLRVNFNLAFGQWIDIDTATHLVVANGTTNIRGETSGEFPSLGPGVSKITFLADEFFEDALLTARWRYAW